MKRWALALLLLTAPLFAGNEDLNTRGGEPAELAVDAMGTKFLRGVGNILTGWGEIPRQLIRSCREDGPLLAIPLGLARGALMAPLRTCVGVLEAGFPFVPTRIRQGRIDETWLRDRDIDPLWEYDYGPILDPPFVWQVSTL